MDSAVCRSKMLQISCEYHLSRVFPSSSFRYLVSTIKLFSNLKNPIFTSGYLGKSGTHFKAKDCEPKKTIELIQSYFKNQGTPTFPKNMVQKHHGGGVRKVRKPNGGILNW